MFVKILVFVVVIFFSSLFVSGDEPTNCGLDKEEQILDKLIRTQVKVESMLNEIRKTEEHVLSVLEYRKQEMQKTLTNTEENVENNIEEMKTELRRLVKRNNTAARNAGSQYVIWGRTTCPADNELVYKDAGSQYVIWGRTTCPADNELVYKGFAGGSLWTKTGSAANWLCLTDQPQWGYYDDKSSGAQVYGAEYEFSDFGHKNGGSDYFGKNLNDKDAPCSVCRPPRSSVIMIPGRLECFSGWTKEYSGYIVSGSSIHASASEFICLDSDAEEVANGNSNTDGRLVYLAEVKCGTLRCPPYVDGRELTCVVCTK